MPDPTRAQIETLVRLRNATQRNDYQLVRVDEDGIAIIERPHSKQGVTRHRIKPDGSWANHLSQRELEKR